MNRHLARDGSWRPMRRSAGFTLIEALLATMIFVFVAGAVLHFVSAAKGQMRKRSIQADLEQQGRVAMELLVDDVRHAGYYMFINDGNDVATTRQHSILEASNYRVAFYADVDPQLYSPLETMTTDTWMMGDGGAYQWVTFPNLFAVVFPGPTTTTDSSSYFTQIAGMSDVPDYLKRTAEVIVYSADSDEDGAFDATDKAQFDAGLTLNPSDAVLRRKVIGTTVDVGGTPSASTSISTVATGVRVYFAPTADQYPSGDIPAPLFVYLLAESFGRFDFDGSGDLNTILIGDCLALDDAGCGDGTLDPNEIASLQTLTQANPSDVVENFAVDARLAAGATSPDVVGRIQTRYPAMSAADATQFMRDCIAGIQVNLIVEQPDVRPNTADVRYSAPGIPYRFIQHDLSAEVFLPNASMLSKNQLLYSANFLENLVPPDGEAASGGTNVYDPTLCPPSPYEDSGDEIPNCWPLR